MQEGSETRLLSHVTHYRVIVKPNHWGEYIHSGHLTLTNTFKLNGNPYCWWWHRSLGVITYQHTENLQLTEFFIFFCKEIPSYAGYIVHLNIKTLSIIFGFSWGSGITLFPVILALLSFNFKHWRMLILKQCLPKFRLTDSFLWLFGRGLSTVLNKCTVSCSGV